MQRGTAVDGQTWQAPTACHHRDCVAARQQRSDLGSGDRIVQQHNEPPVCGERAVEAHPFLRRSGDTLRRYSQPPQEAAQYLARRGRAVRGLGPEVRVQLAVGVMGAQGVQPGQREDGFTDSAEPGQRQERRAAPLLGAGSQPFHRGVLPARSVTLTSGGSCQGDGSGRGGGAAAMWIPPYTVPAWTAAPVTVPLSSLRIVPSSVGCCWSSPPCFEPVRSICPP